MIILWTFAQLLLQYCDSHKFLVLIIAKEFKIFFPVAVFTFPLDEKIIQNYLMQISKWRTTLHKRT